MIKITFLYAMALIVLGIGGYVISDFASITALIPAFFGIVFLVLGALARSEPLRGHMMHAASILSLLGFLGTMTGFMSLFTLLAGGEVERPLAVISRSSMAFLSLVYFGFCLHSFIKVRRARKKD